MSCQVKDVLISLGADGAGHAVPRALVQAVPTMVPFSLKQGSSYSFVQNPEPVSATDAGGNWSLTLPWPSESNPSAEQWQILFPDGTVYQGAVPEAQNGPLTLWQLRNTYGWVSVTTAAGLSVPVSPATTGNLGDVVIDYPPVSGYPIALTVAGIQKQAVPASGNSGLFSLGNGPFDGVSAGHFAGVFGAAGTVLAINLPATYVGGYLDFQRNGVSYLYCDWAGNMASKATFQPWHFLSAAWYGLPTISSVNAGISGTPTVAGTDHGMAITFTTTGAPPAASTVLFQVNYSGPFGAAPYVLCGLLYGIPGGGGQWYPGNLSTTSFVVSATGALAASTTYTVVCIVLR